MSEQIKDPFIWNNNKYIFIGAEDIYALFNPEKYGLNPTAPHTACWKGFVLHFLLKNNKLYLSKLQVYCEDDNYPTINNVNAIKEDSEFFIYDNLNLELKYTGTVVIGTELLPFFRRKAFTGPHCFLNTYDLHFSDGVLTSYEDSTEKYSE